MKFSEFFTTDGCYDRTQYNAIEVIIHFLPVMLTFLVIIHVSFLILIIPVWLLAWYLDIVSTIKRLHDLGRSSDDMIKLFIPFVGTFLDWKLHYQAGQDELDAEAEKDYRAHEYDKKIGGHKPTDY